MTPLAEKRDKKLNRLNYLKAKFDRGDKSDALYQEMNNLLTQVETIDVIGSRSNRAQSLPGDGPLIRSTTGPFDTLGEQLLAVRNAATPGGQTDQRLFETRATGLSESIPSDGGFVVQQDFRDELLREVFDTGILASRCRRFPVSGNSLKIPGLDETSRATGSRQGGVRGYWADEATEKTASKPKFREINLKPYKLIGLCYATDELLEDARALEEYLRVAFASEFGFLTDEAIVNGSGAGQPLGIMNSGCMVEISKEVGQAAATIVYENILKMWARLIPSAMSDAVWLVNGNCFPQLGTMSLSVGSGGSAVYVPAGGASAAPYGTLMGRPVIPIEQCQTVGTAGDIILANFRRGYLLAEKGGIQSDMSIHVQFIYDESVFRFVLRLDGQPMLRSAITPFKGSDTVSHFVRIETRS